MIQFSLFMRVSKFTEFRLPERNEKADKELQISEMDENTHTHYWVAQEGRRPHLRKEREREEEEIFFRQNGARLFMIGCSFARCAKNQKSEAEKENLRVAGVKLLGRYDVGTRCETTDDDDDGDEVEKLVENLVRSRPFLIQSL